MGQRRDALPCNLYLCRIEINHCDSWAAATIGQNFAPRPNRQRVPVSAALYAGTGGMSATLRRGQNEAARIDGARAVASPNAPRR